MKDVMPNRLSQYLFGKSSPTDHGKSKSRLGCHFGLVSSRGAGLFNAMLTRKHKTFLDVIKLTVIDCN